MKKAFALVAICFLNANLLYAQPSSIAVTVTPFSPEKQRTIDVLQILKLEGVVPQAVNAPIEFEVTDKTIDYLKQMQSKGKTLVIGDDGTITFKFKGDKKDSTSK